jgi:hypothetical protein
MDVEDGITYYTKLRLDYTGAPSVNTWRDLWTTLFPGDAAVPLPSTLVPVIISHQCPPEFRIQLLTFLVAYEPDITLEVSDVPNTAMDLSESCVPITDSGYASAFNPVLLDAQPGSLGEKLSPSAEAPEGEGGASEDDARTTYSAATTIAPAGSRYYISELSHEIFKRLGQSLNLRQVADRPKALPELIKAFCIWIGREFPSQTNRDIMYFVHRHHR